jgi:hypothetical protein
MITKSSWPNWMHLAVFGILYQFSCPKSRATIAVGIGPATVAQLHQLFPVRFLAGGAFPPGCHREGTSRSRSPMVKETKFFRKQAAKAERMAQAAADPEISQGLLNMARAYRSQADVLKAKKKSGKKRR